MVKKTLALLLSLLLLLPVLAGIAEDAAEKEAVEKLNVLVIDYLKSQKYSYEFDGVNRFQMQFDLDNTLQTCSVQIYTYYDGISFSAWPDIDAKPEHMANTALYVALVNTGIFYGQIILDPEDGSLRTRAFHLAEETLPGLQEVDVLLHMQLYYLEVFGEGLKAVAVDGADPFQEFEKAEAEE